MHRLNRYNYSIDTHRLAPDLPSSFLFTPSCAQRTSDLFYLYLSTVLRYLLAIALLISGLPVLAQGKKLPKVNISANLKVPPQISPADAAARSYREVIFRPGNDGSYDSNSLRVVSYAGGHLLEVAEYNYLNGSDINRYRELLERIPSRIE